MQVIALFVLYIHHMFCIAEMGVICILCCFLLQLEAFGVLMKREQKGYEKDIVVYAVVEEDDHTGVAAVNEVAGMVDSVGVWGAKARDVLDCADLYGSLPGLRPAS